MSRAELEEFAIRKVSHQPGPTVRRYHDRSPRVLALYDIPDPPASHRFLPR